jgi:WD40 repeat protein
VRSFAGHQPVAFSPSGILATGFTGRDMQLWSPDTESEPVVLSWPERHMNRLVWSPDDKMLGCGSDNGMVWLCDPAGGRVLRELEGHTASVNTVAFSPDGRILASGSDDSTVRLWDVESGQLARKLEGHTKKVFAVAFSPDGRLIASTGGDKTLRLCQVASGEPVQVIRPLYHGKSLAWSADGETLAIGTQPGGVQILDLRSGVIRLSGAPSHAAALAWSSDGKALAAGGEDGTIRFWEAGTYRRGGVLLSLPEGQWLAISPEGHYRGSPGVGRELVYVVETDQGQETLTPEEFAAKYGWKNEPDKVRLWPSVKASKAGQENAEAAEVVEQNAE